MCVLCKLDCFDLVRRLQAIEQGTSRRAGGGAGGAGRVLACGRHAGVQQIPNRNTINVQTGIGWPAGASTFLSGHTSTPSTASPRGSCP